MKYCNYKLIDEERLKGEIEVAKVSAIQPCKQCTVRKD